MLHIYFGEIDPNNMKDIPRYYIHNVDAFFDAYFEEEWMQNEIAKRAVKEIDKSELIAPKIIESPVLKTISHEWLSGGAKQIIMSYSVPEVVYDGDNLGDNCWPLLLEISKERDIAISLSYYPIFKWVDDTQVHILNSDEIVSSFDEFNTRHIKLGDKYFEFKSINWQIPIDTTKFALEDFDF
ncbi:MAG: DUF4869 domain-containing protein [Lachnospiraceae bacterium]|nr:DUF4869 domain-containing protein [Lachnospiraceae bacterium]